MLPEIERLLSSATCCQSSATEQLYVACNPLASSKLPSVCGVLHSDLESISEVKSTLLVLLLLRPTDFPPNSYALTPRLNCTSMVGV